MSYLRCPDCNELVHSNLVKCPNCGLSIDEVLKANKQDSKTNQLKYNNRLPKRKHKRIYDNPSGLSVSALILSILGITSFLGLLFAIIDLLRAHNCKKRFSVIALIFSIMWICIIAVLLFDPKEILEKKVPSVNQFRTQVIYKYDFGIVPADSVKKYIEANKESDITKLNRYVLPDISLFENYENEHYKPMWEFANTIAPEMNYEVVETIVEGDKVSVVVEFDYTDGSEIVQALNNHLLELYDKSPNYFTDLEEDEIESLILSALIRKKNEMDVSRCKETIVFECVKRNGEWYISNIPKEFTYVIFGNVNKALENKAIDTSIVAIVESKPEPYLHEPSIQGNSVRFADIYNDRINTADWINYQEGCWWEIEEDSDSREVRRTMYNSDGQELEYYQTAYGLGAFIDKTTKNRAKYPARILYMHYIKGHPTDIKVDGWEVEFFEGNNTGIRHYTEYDGSAKAISYEFYYDHDKYYRYSLTKIIATYNEDGQNKTKTITSNNEISKIVDGIKEKSLIKTTTYVDPLGEIYK